MSNGLSGPPCDWIPPEFREFVYQDMTQQEIDRIVGSIGHFDSTGQRINWSAAEISANGINKKIIGVKDTRTGKIHWNSSHGNTFLLPRLD